VSARGAGLVYRGSLEAMQGTVVVWMKDCKCLQCKYLTGQGRPLGRVWVEVVDAMGFPDEMHHARPESFVAE
jgi:hypothetical protein